MNKLIEPLYEFNPIVKTLHFEIKQEIIAFFNQENFRILKQFKKSKSLFLHKNTNYMFKIINLLQKRGLRTKYKNILVESMLSLVFFSSKDKITELSKETGLISLFEIIKNVFLNFNLTFAYTITRIDKSKRKNTRNKMEKYFFLWKYIPYYKRRNTFLKLFIKDVKFMSQKYLKLRFKATFLSIMNDFNLYLKKNINFINIYVFKNLRNTLFLNYKTIK